MENTAEPGNSGAQAGSDKPDKPVGNLKAIELLAGINFSNRFIWLVYILALAILAQLSFIQAKYMRFDTLVLISHINVVIEAAFLLILVILFSSTPRVRQAWKSRYAGHPFSYICNNFASILVAIAFLVLLVLPVLWFHRYPELVAENIRVPLMLLQRVVLVLLVALISFNLMSLFRVYLRIPWIICALLGVAAHIGMGYYITFLSFTTETYSRLNDVFYYNQLWRYFDGFPVLVRQSELFHNIEMPYFGYFVMSGAVIWAFTMLLWIPKAAQRINRD